MTHARWILRSLAFHGRGHVATGLGVAVAAAVLVGALAVGTSVRSSLERLALLRLGRVHLAVATGECLFRADLAGEHPLQMIAPPAAGGVTAPGVPSQRLQLAPALRLPGVATTADGGARANEVQVLGVDPRFWALADRPVLPGVSAPIAPDGVVLGAPLARQLRVREGDELILRVQKPSALSRDAPLTPTEESAVALRLRVRAIADDGAFGRFGLAANQVAALNAFVSLAVLQARVGATGGANLLLAGMPPPPAAASAFGSISGVYRPPVMPPAMLREGAQRALRSAWQLADAGLEWNDVPESGVLELRSPRVFLDAALGAVVCGESGDTNSFPARVRRQFPALRMTGVLTYFVNELRSGDRATPYSMVTAIGAPATPEDLGDNEMLVSEWLAEDLAVGPGDEVTLKYYVVGVGRELTEATARFRVRGIYPRNAPGIDRHLMPQFPGMTAADNCRDWDTGLPIDTGRIRDKDERYWDEQRGTPKALITLEAGRKLWANRFGDLTAVRFYGASPGVTSSRGSAVVPPVWAGAARSGLTALLRQQLDPAAFGLRFEPVRAQALAASAQGQDFGQLFLGFSLFLMVAALLLIGLLFQFGVEQRAIEVGTLLALGFRGGQIRVLLWAEGMCVALLGCGAGAWAGIAYARAMLHGLSTAWSDAVGGASVAYHADWRPLALGVAAALGVTAVSMGLALRRQGRQPARQLMASGAELEAALEGSIGLGSPTAARGRRFWIACLASLGALLLVGFGIGGSHHHSPGLFFGAGGLLWVAGLAWAGVVLGRIARATADRRLTVGQLGVRSVTRRPRRSLAVIGLLAAGSFLIVAIGVFRLDAGRDADRRSSGTGGFALVGHSTQPVLEDLNTGKGRESYGLDAAALAGVGVVPFRVRDGDEASCLNLNRAQQPRLLGVNPGELARRGAFTFAAVAPGRTVSNPWLLLERGPGASDEVPAIGDAASITWALGKRVGDTVDVTDERGQLLRLRLVAAVANSILQGNLIIAEQEMARRFPSVAGHRFFLVDVPSEGRDRVSAELTRALRDQGLELVSAVERLAAFNAVQNTYLGTFQALGGLGLLLGSMGLGVVVLRNVWERRGELAVLLAMGWRPGSLRRLVLIEHGALLGCGLAVGLTAATVAVLPSLLTPGATVPLRSLSATLAGVLVSGALWTWGATVLALRGRLLDALRNA